MAPKRHDLALGCMGGSPPDGLGTGRTDEPASPSTIGFKSQGPSSPLRQAGNSLMGKDAASPMHPSSPRSPGRGAAPASPQARPGGLATGATAKSSLAQHGSLAIVNGTGLNGKASASQPGTSTPGGGTGAAASQPVVAAPSSDLDFLPQFHSAIRWAKPWKDIEKSIGGCELRSAAEARDPKNGNCAIHIAAQNGHEEIVEKLIASGASVNGQNSRGQTALHMTVEYDFYFVSKALLDAGANRDLENDDGNKAIFGIDGGKIGKLAWDNPVAMLKAAMTPPQLEESFQALEKANAEAIDKAELIQTGLSKKKSPLTKEAWNHMRFLAIVANV